MNKQLYENSPVKQMAAENGHKDADALFNQLDPNLAILHEKPEHRQILWMKARGHSNRECAQATGYTDAWISQLTRQPWFRSLLLKEMNDAGRDEVETLLEGAAADSVLKLIELRDKAPPTVARQSAVDLLDRFLGKPTQRVETQVTTTADAATVEELDAEIARLSREELNILHRN